jgi:hypothetical protein
MNRSHLRREHRLNLVAWLDPLHHAQHKIDPVFVRLLAL